MLPEILKVLQPWLAVLGGFGAAAVLLVTAAYWLFRFFGEKWLSAKFDERLAAYKHAQQKELERLKFEINALTDRTVKLHQREFDVIPEAWSRANDAFSVMRSVGLGLHQYPDISRMSDPALESFLEHSDLEGWQKDELRKAPNRTDYYIEAIKPIRLWKADATRNEFSAYLAKNGIFIPEPMKARFSMINTLLFDAALERRLSIQHPNQSQKFDAGLILHQQGPELLKALEVEVQARLWKSQIITPIE